MEYTSILFGNGIGVVADLQRPWWLTVIRGCNVAYNRAPNLTSRFCLSSNRQQPNIDIDANVYLWILNYRTYTEQPERNYVWS